MAIIDRCRLWINGTLEEAQMSVKWTDESTREPFIRNGEEEVFGTSLKPGAKYLEVAIKPRTKPSVDYIEMKRTGETARATLQYYGGALKGDRWQCNVQVAEGTLPESDNEGKAEQTIKLVIIGKPKRLSKGA